MVIKNDFSIFKEFRKQPNNKKRITEIDFYKIKHEIETFYYI